MSLPSGLPSSTGEEQVLTYLESGGPPSQSLQEQEAEGKGGVGCRLVKVNDAPTLVRRGMCAASHTYTRWCYLWALWPP